MAFMKTPLTDPFAYIFNYQGESHGNPLCKALEMQFFKCMEAAGVPNFKRSCKDEYDDFSECVTQKKQKERYVCIQNERERQFRNGTLKEKYLHNPELQAYGPADWRSL